jgi:hypothetical protein
MISNFDDKLRSDHIEDLQGDKRMDIMLDKLKDQNYYTTEQQKDIARINEKLVDKEKWFDELLEKVGQTDGDIEAASK